MRRNSVATHSGVASVVTLWALTAVAVVTGVVTGTVAGYRADEAAGAPAGAAVDDVSALSAASWVLVVSALVTFVAAMIVTVRRARGTNVRAVAPVLLIVVGAVASVFLLGAAVVSVAGLVWLVVTMLRRRR
ncbi:hypothetical protein P5G50_06765 [Leifsonia sp. F6_8S_P_1B]|uniref:DUF4064 domain-containing protein n=1 Tax=Leifsonia williamsii TaxID=3035919 RepID=A0ABT8KAS1_9MICO|nr:hypothetical protein [Leifsonia williamsii]MDN4614152.1 hypothetical protein [Leifsonia williamsii]